MTLHDEYARRTPIEVAFPKSEELADFLERARSEGTARGVDLTDLHHFMSIGSVAAAANRLTGGAADEADRVRLGALLYQAHHFMGAGAPLFVLTGAAARYLTDGEHAGPVAPPTPAGYLQLPQHLFWSPGGEGDRPESVDGLFWTVTPRGGLQTLVVADLRDEGDGFSVLPMPEAPLADAESWLSVRVRGDEVDFASGIPGADIDGLLAFHQAGEVLKLLARFFALAGGAPGEVRQGAHPGPADGPAPSAFPYRRVTLDA